MTARRMPGGHGECARGQETIRYNIHTSMFVAVMVSAVMMTAMAVFMLMLVVMAAIPVFMGMVIATGLRVVS